MLKNIEWRTPQGTQYFDVLITPVFDSNKQLLGSILSFVDKTNFKRSIEKLESTNAELEKIQEVLKVTQAELESADRKIQLLEKTCTVSNNTASCVGDYR
jgi:two-component system, chemotaxis family, CheB/CheR fusion protein